MDEQTKKEMQGGCAVKVLSLFGQKIAESDEFDYERFVMLSQDIKKETGCKGKELYHPLRIALTARGSGVDLDKFIPLVEKGAGLKLPRALKDCRQRVFQMLDYMRQRGPVRNEEIES
jgi:glutamyl-tRNA synthetase/nondiscriminating glutamyl-tRNA synthetase